MSLSLLLRRLREDARGVSMIEFSVIAPFLALMLIGIADLGRGYAHSFALQQAVNRTIEMAHTGTAEEDYTYLEAAAASAAGVEADPNVAYRDWVICEDGTEYEDFHAKCEDEDGNVTDPAARYVSIQVSKPFDPLFTSAGYPNVQEDGTVPMTARAALRVQ